MDFNNRILVVIKKLSVYIIACNEELSIERCLRSCLSIADEIILVTNDTTDSTVEIAKSFGAKCSDRSFVSLRDQKSYAFSLCTHSWTLSLDADEVLSKSLQVSIRDFLDSPISDVYEGAKFNRLSFFLGRWIKHGDWYPDRKTRLCQKSTGVWSGLPEHDLIKVNGRVKFLNGDLLHYSYANINELIEKTIYFTDEYIKRVSGSVNFRVLSTLEIIFRSMFRFFRGYFLKLGFLDGLPGLIIAINSAHSVFVKYTKLRFESKFVKKHENCSSYPN